jgi:hypothetical protein
MTALAALLLVALALVVIAGNLWVSVKHPVAAVFCGCHQAVAVGVEVIGAVLAAVLSDR